MVGRSTERIKVIVVFLEDLLHLLSHKTMKDRASNLNTTNLILSHLNFVFRHPAAPFTIHYLPQ